MKDELLNHQFVVFSDDWGRHPSSCQHLFKRIIPHADVLWVNTIGLRTPRITLYDLKRTAEVLKSWILPEKKHMKHREKKSPTLEPKVISPFMLPFYQWEWVEKLNNIFILNSLKRELAHLDHNQKVILVSTLPIIPEVFKSDLFAKTIYYCVDDFAHWPGVDGQTMRNLEEKTLPHCDMVIAVSKSLYQGRQDKVSQIALLTHGVDVEHFRVTDSTEEAPALQNITSPIAGFFGMLDERSNLDILIDLARKCPDLSIVLIGPVDRDLSELEIFQNIYILGKVPYQELPTYIKKFDVFLLPYEINHLTENINPLKLKEYLATEKPVVSTKLKEALPLASYIHLVEPEEFTTEVKDIVYNQKSSPSGVAEFLSHESWDSKAEEFIAFIKR